MAKFVDSNIFIYHIDRNPTFGGRARQVLESIEEGEEAITSTLVLEEVFIHVEQEYSAKDIPTVLHSIISYDSLKIIPYTVEDMLRATEILQDLDFAVDWDDAVISSVMERHGIEEIYSNDHHFDRISFISRIF